ncbi:MAG: hypothetical protein KGI68_11205 [Alphaproteobacteria bacterium]|nr:hypothetical protein [Alphaproteobacteria bacterium]
MTNSHFVVHDAEGNVRCVGKCPTAALPNMAPDGHTFLEIDEETAHAIRADIPSYRVQNGEVTRPGYSLDYVKQLKLRELEHACDREICSGFSYAGRNYPSDETAQRNMIFDSTGGGVLWCESEGTWSFIPHTREEAQAVIAAFGVSRVQAQNKLTALKTAVGAAADVGAVRDIQF